MGTNYKNIDKYINKLLENEHAYCMKNSKWNKKILHINEVFIPLLVASILSSSFSTTSFAASPEFARSNEEWVTLKDYYLDYNEIPDLIHEYNATVQSNQYEYRKFLKEYGKTNDEVSEAYRDLANDFYDSMTGDDDAGSMMADLQLETQAKNMLRQADNSLEDSHIYLLTYEQTKKSLTATAQSNMISYYQNLISNEINKLNEAESIDAQTITNLKFQHGILTQLDVMKANDAVISARDNIAETERSIKNEKESLLVSLGWKYNDDITLGELPVGITLVITESDLEKALDANFTLKINERKLENAKESLTRQNLERTISDNKKKIASDLEISRKQIESVQATLSQANIDLTYQKELLNQGENKHHLGLLTDSEYRTLQRNVQKAELSVSSCNISLFQALETYRNKVEGLASA